MIFSQLIWYLNISLIESIDDVDEIPRWEEPKFVPKSSAKAKNVAVKSSDDYADGNNLPKKVKNQVIILKLSIRVIWQLYWRADHGSLLGKRKETKEDRCFKS